MATGCIDWYRLMLFDFLEKVSPLYLLQGGSHWEESQASNPLSRCKALQSSDKPVQAASCQLHGSASCASLVTLYVDYAHRIWQHQFWMGVCWLILDVHLRGALGTSNQSQVTQGTESGARPGSHHLDAVYQLNFLFSHLVVEMADATGDTWRLWGLSVPFNSSLENLFDIMIWRSTPQEMPASLSSCVLHVNFPSRLCTKRWTKQTVLAPGLWIRRQNKQLAVPPRLLCHLSSPTRPQARRSSDPKSFGRRTGKKAKETPGL